MSRLTPSEAREKHARNLKAAVRDIERGVDRVTEAPGAAAARKQDKMLANVMEAVSSGKWARRVAAVPLEEWKDKMKNKGIGRIASGIDASAAKMEEFYAELFPFQDSLQGKIKGMPDLTLEDSISRASEWMRGMAKFSKSR